MLSLILFATAILLEIVFAIGFSIYVISLIYSNLKGSPYVPTRNKELDVILDEARLKKNAIFIELGCGDARVSRRAVLKYHVRAVAIDINPLLIRMAKIWSRIQHVKHISFKVENILESDVSKADFIYLFLMPKLIEKLEKKFVKELPRRTLIISHGFQMESKTFRLIKHIERRPFFTYYYQRN